MLHEAPQFNKEYGLALSPDMKIYHPKITKAFRHHFTGDKFVDIRTHAFPNNMPLYLVGSARHTMMITWINGDNWQNAFCELAHIGSALTLDIDPAGPNTETLGVFLPFCDTRQDKRTRKPVPDSIDKAVVKSQSVFTIPVARTLRNVAGADYVVSLDLHSQEAAKAFTDVGLYHVPLSATRLFADQIRRSQLLANNLETIVSTTDLGGLNRAWTLAQNLETDIAIILKQRFTTSQGIETTNTETKSRLVYGKVKDKRVVLIDDMISSGGTSKEAVKLMLELGAAELILCATHPVFTGDYYKNLQEILRVPQVLSIMVTDSLPLEERRPSASPPYVTVDGKRKKVEVLPIGNFLATSAETILTSPTIETAKEQLAQYILEMKDPYTLFAEITRQSLQRPEDIAVYHRGGELTALPPAAVLYEDG